MQIVDIDYQLASRPETLEELGKLNPDWRLGKILDKTGVRTRHVSVDGETASTLAETTARRLLDRVGADTVDGLIYVTQSPESTLPTTACLLQDRLGLPQRSLAFDLIQGCSGFVYALSVGAGLLDTAGLGRVMIVCAEHYSKYISRHDRTSRPIFSDGAAACVVDADGTGAVGPFVFATDGAGAPHLALTPNEGVDDVEGPVLFMDGKKVLTFTMRMVPEATRELLDKAGLGPDDVDLYVFHQASAVVLRRLRARLGIPEAKWFQNLEEVGNTVSATIPLALRQAQDAGRIRPGMTVVLMGFGVGLSLAGCVVRT